jgi:hypothetical protein
MTTEADTWDAIIEDVKQLDPFSIEHSRDKLTTDMIDRRDYGRAVYSIPSLLSEAYGQALDLCLTLRKACAVVGVFDDYMTALRLAYRLRSKFHRDERA